jgi:hypothetical protein
MNVTVALLSGESIYPVYSPEHKDSVMAFYANAKAKGEIAGYIIRFDNGNMIAEGQVL